MSGLQVIKIGGAALADPTWLTRFAAAPAMRGCRVIVHGGGPGSQRAVAAARSIEVQWHGGRRVTSEAALDVASQVLTGRINKRIVRALRAAGADAIGVSGEDAGLVTARITQGGALGRVGEVDLRCGARSLQTLLAAGTAAGDLADIAGRRW